MKLQKVRINRFQTLSNIDVEPMGANILLLGDNGVGKSTFIRFIRIALGDKSDIPPNASGEGEVYVTKDGREYTFQVSFKNGKPVVTIISPDGIQDQRKSVLASLVGALEFNIEEFVDLSKTLLGRRKQIEIFKSFLPEEVQFDLKKLENKVKDSYNERTELNRIIKSTEIEIRSHDLYGLINTATFQQIDVEKVYKELQLARDHNQKRIEMDHRIVERELTITDINLDISELERLIREKREAIETNKTLNDQAINWLQYNTEIDVEESEKSLSSANEMNRVHTSSVNLKQKVKLLEEMKEEAGEMTALIDSSKGAIEEAIKDMDTPVPDLFYDMEGLVYKGNPVHPSVLSTAEIGHLGIQLKMAENPDLGIIFIANGQNYGSKRLAEIESYGWQIVMEQVERGTEELKIQIEAT